MTTSAPVEPPSLDFSSAEPLLNQVAGHYREKIRNRLLPIGTRLPTCLELSKTVGVAPQTINRAFDLLAREGLVYRRRSVGTVVGPAPADRPMRATRQRQPASRERPLCVSFNDWSTTDDELEYISSDYFSGLQEGFARCDSAFQIAYSKPGQRRLDTVKELIAHQSPSGIISTFLEEEVIDFLLTEKIPLVSLGEDLTHRGIPSIIADHIRGYAAAWKDAAAKGHQRAAFLGYRTRNPKRRRECAAGLELSGAEIALSHTLLLPDLGDARNIEQQIEEEWGPYDPETWPSLVFTQTDFLATQLYRALQAFGLSVPAQISIIGFNDTPLARSFHPMLSTISKPRCQMGAAAANLLNELLSHGPTAVEGLRLFNLELTLRETTR